MTTTLTHLLYVISNALLIPVILALLALFAWTLLMAGGFLREAWRRRRVRAGIDSALAIARAGDASARLWDTLRDAGSGVPKRFAELCGPRDRDDAGRAQALARLEHDIADSVARHSFVTRVSPMLGLMGTLIPLGPALSGLSSGDMGALAGNLTVAFTATVIGLLISGAAYGIGLARRAWYARDLTDLEHLTARLRAVEV